MKPILRSPCQTDLKPDASASRVSISSVTRRSGGALLSFLECSGLAEEVRLGVVDPSIETGHAGGIPLRFGGPVFEALLQPKRIQCVVPDFPEPEFGTSREENASELDMLRGVEVDFVPEFTTNRQAADLCPDQADIQGSA